ncbi:MAG: hypothetical protein AABY22_30075 [Nanoarchaeota archaeon]
MKIIKKDCVELWFSPKRFKRETDTIIYYFKIIGRFNAFHRKIGPALFSKKLIYWAQNGIDSRVNGARCCDLNSKPDTWGFAHIISSEETYWNY